MPSWTCAPERADDVLGLHQPGDVDLPAGARANGRQPVGDANAKVAAGILPPPAPSNIVSAYLDAPVPGLAHVIERFTNTRYQPKLQLDYIRAPSLGVATSPFGTGLSGAIALYFGDMLGDRIVGGAVQAQGTIKDIGGEVFYLNQKHRGTGW